MQATSGKLKIFFSRFGHIHVRCFVTPFGLLIAITPEPRFRDRITIEYVSFLNVLVYGIIVKVLFIRAIK